MKKYKNILLFISVCLFSGGLFAQDPVEARTEKKAKPVKNTFGSVWLMDNQTVMVPIKGNAGV